MNKKLEKSQAESVVKEEAQVEEDLLGKILSQGKLARNEVQAAQSKDMIAEFVQQVMEGQLVMGKDLEGSINARIAQIDKLVSAQLNAIMHAEEFQKLEGSWRGLHHLVFESETGTNLKVRVLNVTKKELQKDLERAPEFDQSAMFKKVYEEEFGTFGGAPIGTIIGDYEFSNHPEDIALL